MSKILGIHQSGPISSAALIINGQIIAAAPEERFTRVKQDSSFPRNSIDFCLSEADLDFSELDIIAVGWNPGINVALRKRPQMEKSWYPGQWLSAVPNFLLPGRVSDVRSTSQVFTDSIGAQTRIEYFNHHDCHAYLAFKLSKFPDAAIAVVDGFGEQSCTTLYKAEGDELTKLSEIVFPQSIGMFYSTITDFLGYRPFSDEWRVMGMAAYGDPNSHSKLDDLITVESDGSYSLDLSFFDFYNFDRPSFYSPKFIENFGPPRIFGGELSQSHFDMAAAAQRVFSRVMQHILLSLHEQTGLERLCLAGGSAMNSLFNGKIKKLTPFEDVFVGFSPDDSGNSIGAALLASKKLGLTPSLGLITSHLGPEYSDSEIRKKLELFKVRFDEVDNFHEIVAQLLAEGNIVGWFHGRSEFGQRALGGRSIIAAATSRDMKDRINSAVKYRESYRPFAPVCLEEDIDSLMHTHGHKQIRFMEMALDWKEGERRFPAVVHQDGTGRVQTVGPEPEHPLRKLLEKYKELTTLPVLLNTSFNLNDEPIVNTPDQAIRTFFSSGIDVLSIGRFIVLK